jgi:hypothetical protein
MSPASAALASSAAGPTAWADCGGVRLRLCIDLDINVYDGVAKVIRLVLALEQLEVDDPLYFGALRIFLKTEDHPAQPVESIQDEVNLDSNDDSLL